MQKLFSRLQLNLLFQHAEHVVGVTILVRFHELIASGWTMHELIDDQQPLLQWSELRAFECFTEIPVGRGDVCGCDLSTIACGDEEGQALSYQVSARLPVLSPITGHLNPRTCTTLDRQRGHVSSATHVGHQYQIEPGVSVDGETNPSSLDAWNPVQGHIS